MDAGSGAWPSASMAGRTQLFCCTLLEQPWRSTEPNTLMRTRVLNLLERGGNCSRDPRGVGGCMAWIAGEMSSKRLLQKDAQCSRIGQLERRAINRGCEGR